MTHSKRRQVILGGAAIFCVAGALVMTKLARQVFSLPSAAGVPMEEVPAVLPTSRSFVVSTDAGMLAVWNPKQFSTIVDYDTWERELLEDKDILRHARDGRLVPINIGRDFAAGVTVRIEPLAYPKLSEREARYLFLSSEPYLYMSDGAMCVSGLESIDRDPDPSGVISIAADRYQVTIHMLNWDDEHGATDESGRPADHALSDFLILVSPEPTPNSVYRVELETFDRSEIRRKLVLRSSVHTMGPHSMMQRRSQMRVRCLTFLSTTKIDRPRAFSRGTSRVTVTFSCVHHLARGDGD
jgi:hypothetical protein